MAGQNPMVSNSSFGFGFSTAGGAPVKISDDALSRAKLLFGDDDDSAAEFASFDKSEVSTGSEIPSGFLTASGKTVTVGETAMSRAQMIWNESSQPQSNSEEMNGAFPQELPNFGFATAGGKVVTISNSAMKRANLLFSDDEDSKPINANQHKLIGKTLEKHSSNCHTGRTLAKYVSNKDRTPLQAPAAANAFRNNRRRLAASPLTNSASRKKHMGIMEKINFMEKSSPVQSPYSPTVASLLFKQKEFSYTSGKSPSAESLIDSEDADLAECSEELLTEKKATTSKQDDTENSFRIFIQPGKWFCKRKNLNADRRKLSKELAGQTPRSCDLEDYERYGVKESTLSVNSSNAEHFEFTPQYLQSSAVRLVGERQILLGDDIFVNLNDSGGISCNNLIDAFMKSDFVDSSLISKKWCQNHYRWIVWKEAAMEVSFPHLFGGKMLTPDRIMYQLKYRYDREIDNTERSALKRILNGDDSSHRPFTICVSAVMQQEGNYLLEVTDGWYCVLAQLDRGLSERLKKEQIFVGQKLFVSRCNILGAEGGCEPLENISNVRLVFTTNSVRRARWDASLGFWHSSRPIVFPLKSLTVNGGTVAALELTVVRVYPLLYFEKRSDGRTSTLNEKAEAREARIFEEQYEQYLERLLGDVEKKCAEERETTKDDLRYTDTQDIRKACDVEDLYDLFIHAIDPVRFANTVTTSQKSSLRDFCARLDERRRAEMRRKVEEEIKKNSTNMPSRKVTPFLKLKVSDSRAEEHDENALTTLTIWRPGEDLMYYFKEGDSYTVTNVNVAPSRSPNNFGFSLVTTSDTKFQKNCFISQANIHRMATPFAELKTITENCSREVDVVGIVIDVANSSKGDTVYLTNSNFEFVALKVFPGVRFSGWSDVVVFGNAIACLNVNFRVDGTPSSKIPHLHASELSVLTINPKDSHLSLALENLVDSIAENSNFTPEAKTKLQTMFDKRSYNSPKLPIAGSDQTTPVPPNSAKAKADHLDMLLSKNPVPSISPLTYLPRSSAVNRAFVPPRKL